VTEDQRVVADGGGGSDVDADADADADVCEDVGERI